MITEYIQKHIKKDYYTPFTIKAENSIGLAFIHVIQFVLLGLCCCFLGMTGSLKILQIMFDIFSHDNSWFITWDTYTAYLAIIFLFVFLFFFLICIITYEIPYRVLHFIEIRRRGWDEL